MSFDSFWSGRSVQQTVFLSVLLTLVIGFLDHFTGYELSFSIFYIIPISIASWYAGRTPSLSISFLSALTWFFADLISGHVYSSSIIPVWNAIVRFGLFSLITVLLSRIKTALDLEQEMADTDGLTGLLNGRAFREAVTRILDLCRRIRRPITLAYIDLDNFKKVNDTFGHTEGDLVLKVIGKAIPASLRSTDIIGRLGGDEFAIILPDTNAQQAKTVIEKMHLQLMKEIGMHNWPIGFSIGVTIFIKPPKTADEAIRASDNLMYRVKKAGKNNILFDEYSETIPHHDPP